MLVTRGRQRNRLRRRRRAGGVGCTGRERAGLSLIELLITMSLLAILLAIGIPSFQGSQERARLRNSAEAVYSLLQFARSEAIKQYRDLFVVVSTGEAGPAGDGWCLAIANDRDCDCSVVGACQYGGGADRQVHSLTSEGFPGVALASNRTSYRFERKLGKCSSAGTLRLTGADSSSITIKVAPLGRVKLCSDDLLGLPEC
ncbi:GspH/FimT family pseudopilin [Halochromatium salexigens]|nr:GspH/FimT family pseudopilin [Halochromatium salexigens]